jgi:4'-phosphopantetheinyl transferase
MQNRSIYLKDMCLTRSDVILKATLCCCFFSSKKDYEEVVQCLHDEERDYYCTLQFEKRIRSYLMGRFVAKQAVAALTSDDLANICIRSGIFTQPIVLSSKENIQVSITHSNNIGGAIAFPESHPMGIDIERIDPDNTDTFERQITKTEKELISGCSLSYEIALCLLWTSKEAISKVLKTGLMTPFEVFEINRIELQDKFIISYYKNFAQYKVISFVLDKYLFSIAHPLRTEISFDIAALKRKFELYSKLDLSKKGINGIL